MALIHCSDPSNHSVAPFGAVTSVFTPNPLSAGIPTSGDPILIDVSASYTTNGMTSRLHKAGETLAHPWVQDADGNATRDPAVLFREPKGTLLPLGGLEAGHKGFGLALLIEALTAGLSGHGRADPSEGWGATVFVQVLDPHAFGGAKAFAKQMDWLVDACHEATPRPAGRACACRASAGSRCTARRAPPASRSTRRSCPRWSRSGAQARRHAARLRLPPPARAFFGLTSVRRPSAVLSAVSRISRITSARLQLRIDGEDLRREVRDLRRRHRRSRFRKLVAAGDDALHLVAVGVHDDRRAVARERRFVAGLVDGADRQQVGQHDAGRNVLGERRILVAVAGRGDEQDVRRAGERLRQRVLLDLEIVARDRLALIGTSCRCCKARAAPRCP